jgi:hypothetical protein
VRAQDCDRSDIGKRRVLFQQRARNHVHFATQPERTQEDIVYEFDASGLIVAGLDPSRLQPLPERGQMTPGVWYFLAKGQPDPHHAHAMANPTIAIAVIVK